MTEPAQSLAERLWRQAHPYTRNMLAALIVLAVLVTALKQLEEPAPRQHCAVKKQARAVPYAKPAVKEPSAQESLKAVVLEQEAKQ